jgi:hypothetical protein
MHPHRIIKIVYAPPRTPENFRQQSRGNATTPRVTQLAAAIYNWESQEAAGGGGATVEDHDVGALGYSRIAAHGFYSDALSDWPPIAHLLEFAS